MTDPQNPRITVVTPSYNQAAYLEECIDSILSQNYPNLEYIIMDGGSTDGSREIIEKHQKRLKYWQSRPDGGQYQALNHAFRISTGEIMAWLNSDDKYHPGALRLVADTFRAFPEVRWLTGSPTLWGADGKARGFSLNPPLWSREKYLRGEVHSPYIQQESTFWRRSLWEEAGGGLDPEFALAADLELWARFFRHARLHTLHAPLGGFRSHPGEGQRSETCRERYEREAESIVLRERRVFSAGGGGELEPAPAPLLVQDVVARAGGRVVPENFGFFNYSRSVHFPYFAGVDLALYGRPVAPGSARVREYQHLLASAFMRDNLPTGARILLWGDADPLIAAAGSGYEFWRLRETGDSPASLPQHCREIRATAGSASRALPDHYFDLAIGIHPLTQTPETEERCGEICQDLTRLLKEGGRSLHCFEVKADHEGFKMSPLIPFLFREKSPCHRFVPLEQAPLDPFAFFRTEQQGDAARRHAASCGEPTRWLSYNVLWTPERVELRPASSTPEGGVASGTAAEGNLAPAAPPLSVDAAAPTAPPAAGFGKAPGSRRLHIGGEKRAEGWEVLNIFPGPHVDHLGNANDLSRFADGSFQEIYASHILEHFDYQNELLATLKEWHRVLQPFGTLYLSVPDLDVLSRLILDRERLNVDDRFAVMRMMFGGHMDRHDVHGVGLNEDFLTYFLHVAGFSLIQKVDRLQLFQDTSQMEFKGQLISLNMVARKLPA